MEKKIENEMETGIIWGIMGINSLNSLKGGLYRGSFRGLLWRILRGILGV